MEVAFRVEDLLPSGISEYSAMELILSHNAREQPRAVFTRLGTDNGQAGPGEAAAFTMPFVHGAKLHLGRYDSRYDAESNDKVILSMTDKRGISRSHGSLECTDDQTIVLVPLVKEGFPTWHNGMLVDLTVDPVRLQAGDVIGFGSAGGSPSIAYQVEFVNVVPLHPVVPVSNVLKPVQSAPVPKGEQTTSSADSWQSEDSETDRSQIARQPSGVLERAQHQMMELRRELQQREIEHERDAEERTTLSSEVVQLRAEIARLRNILANQVADSVAMSPGSRGPSGASTVTTASSHSSEPAKMMRAAPPSPDVSSDGLDHAAISEQVWRTACQRYDGGPTLQRVRREAARQAAATVVQAHVRGAAARRAMEARRPIPQQQRRLSKALSFVEQAGDSLRHVADASSRSSPWDVARTRSTQRVIEESNTPSQGGQRTKPTHQADTGRAGRPLFGLWPSGKGPKGGRIGCFKLMA